jgi:hypothetical protein
MLPAVMGTAKAASKFPAGKAVVDAVGPWTARAHDIFTPGGKGAAHAERVEALTHGAQGIRNTRALYALHGARGHLQADIEQQLNTAYDRATKDLSDREKLSVFRAIHSGKIDKLPAKLQTAAKQVQGYDRSIAYLSGGRALRQKMVKDGFQLPSDMQRFDTGARKIINSGNYMEKHVPMPHEFTPDELAAAQNRIQVRGRTKLSKRNLQFAPRKPGAGPAEDFYSIKDPALHEQLFRQSFAKAGKSIANADLEDSLARMFGKRSPVVRRAAVGEETIDRAIQAYNAGNPYKQMDRAAYDNLSQSVKEIITNPHRGSVVTPRSVIRASTIPKHIRGYFEKPGKAVDSDLQRLPDFFRNVSDISRASLFTTPVQHSARIGSLLALHAPEAFPSALGKFARTRLGFADAEAQSKVLGKGMKAGAVGAPNVEQSKLVSLLSKGGAPGKLAAKYFTGVGKMLWGWDAAAKDALFERYIQRYGDPLQAAYHVQKDLVNYGHSSPFIEGARTISSFPTWRARMPVAVGRALLREPQNAAGFAKTPLGQFMLGQETGQPGDDTRHRFSASAPAELTGTAKDIPSAARKYLVGSLSPTTRLGGYAAARALFHSSPGEASSAFLYGQKPAAYVRSSLPFAGQAQEMTGHGMFPSTPNEGALQSIFGIESLHPRGWQPPAAASKGTAPAKGPVDLLKGTP